MTLEQIMAIGTEGVVIGNYGSSNNSSGGNGENISTRLKLNKTLIYIVKGDTDQLSANTENSVTYTSSDSSVAGVSASGTVTGVSVGTATITVRESTTG